MDDICYDCDGTGERDFLSGAPCYTCGGSGFLEDREDDPCESCERCGCDMDDEGLCSQCLWYVEQYPSKPAGEGGDV